MVLGLRRFVVPLALLACAVCMGRGEATPETVAVAAEAEAPVASSSPPPPAAAPLLPVDPSPFHDAVVSYRDSEGAMLPNALTLCPFEQRTFVCGVTEAPLRSTEAGVENDVAMEAAIASGKAAAIGRVFRSAGRWPDTAMLLVDEPGTPLVHGYRYAGDAWTRFGEWQRGESELAAAWERGLLVTDVAVNVDMLGGPFYALRRTRSGGGFESPQPSRVLDANAQIPAERRRPIVAMASRGNALFTAVVRDTELVVERRVDGEKAPIPLRIDSIVAVPSSADLRAGIWVGGPYDAVLYGEEGPPSKPILERFDGERWTPMAPPPGTSGVVAYEGTAVGVERIFVRVGDALALFERPYDAPKTADSWRSVLLPSLPAGDRFHDVWLANEDAWLLVWPQNTRERAPHLMRLSPVERVWVYPH